jgi:hypothetical protein
VSSYGNDSAHLNKNRPFSLSRSIRLSYNDGFDNQFILGRVHFILNDDRYQEAKCGSFPEKNESFSVSAFLSELYLPGGSIHKGPCPTRATNNNLYYRRVSSNFCLKILTFGSDHTAIT